MRKADYAALAEQIKSQYEGQKWQCDFDPYGIHRHAMLCLERLARNFADKASVTPGEFLKACGIEP